MTKPLPSTIFMVDRIPHPDDRKWYGFDKLRRFYTQWRHVTLFMKSNKRSEFKVYEADVVWREVNPDDRRTTPLVG